MKLSLKLTFGATIWLIKRNIKTILLFSLFYCILYYVYVYGSTYFYLSKTIPQFNDSKQFAIPLDSLKSLESEPYFIKSPNTAITSLLVSIIVNILYSIGSFLGCYLFIILIINKDATPPVPLTRQLRYVLGRLIPLYLTTIFYSVVVGVGMVFFIIPGVFFAIKYSQAVMFAVINGDNQSNAFKHSAAITNGNYLRIIRQALVIGILYIVLLVPVMLLPIPPFIKMFYYFFILFVGEIVNYVTWKILKQNFDMGHVQQPTTSLWRKIYITVLILFILVMAGIAIKFVAGRALESLAPTHNEFVLNIAKLSPLSQTKTIPSLTSTPFPTPTIVDMTETKGWQSYTNKAYGYSIKYPQDFVVQSLSEKVPNILKSPNIAIRSVDGKKYISITAENSMGIDKKIRDTQSAGVTLYLENDTVYSGHKVVVMSTDGGFSGISQYIAFIEKDITSTLVIKLGPIPEGKEKEYKDFFYQAISTVVFKK
jgi:hypothetical protein